VSRGMCLLNMFTLTSGQQRIFVDKGVYNRDTSGSADCNRYTVGNGTVGRIIVGSTVWYLTADRRTVPVQQVPLLICVCANDGYVKLLVTADVRIISNTRLLKGTCIHTYIHTYTHTYIHTHTYVHTHIHTYIHIYIHIRTYKRT